MASASMPRSEPPADGRGPGGGRARRALAKRLRYLVVGLALCIAGGEGGGLAWWLDLFSHFQLQYFLASVLSVAAALVLRARRWALLAAVCAAVTAARVAPWYVTPAPSTAVDGAPGLRVALVNVQTANQGFDEVARVVLEQGVDLVVLEEVDARWLDELAAALPAHTHVVRAPRNDNFGIAILSRRPLDEAAVFVLATARVPTLEAVVRIGDVRVTIVATHPVPPVGRDRTRLRDEQIAAVAARVAARDGAVILLGDLNVTMWSRPYRRLIDDGRLSNARRGFGITPTWPAGFPAAARIPIDHCLHRGPLVVTGCRSGPDIGSDHLPLIVDFEPLSE